MFQRIRPIFVMFCKTTSLTYLDGFLATCFMVKKLSQPHLFAEAIGTRSPNPLLFQVDLVTLIFRSLTQPMAILKGYMMINYGHLAGILKGYLFEIKKPQKS